MRESMPETAAFVDRMRAEMGEAHVKRCLQLAMKGEPGHFYAIEGGHVTGTPFPAGTPIAEDQARAVLWGCKFAAFMAKPEVPNGAN